MKKMSQVFIPPSLRALFGLGVLRLVSAWLLLLLLLLLLGAVAEALKNLVRICVIGLQIYLRRT